jgi:hypothetical protein
VLREIEKFRKQGQGHEMDFPRHRFADGWPHLQRGPQQALEKNRGCHE